MTTITAWISNILLSSIMRNIGINLMQMRQEKKSSVVKQKANPYIVSQQTFNLFNNPFPFISPLAGHPLGR